MYDIVIVGGGPAGVAAAYDARLAGMSTLILDKQEFPRFKPCAGGVTTKALQKLRYSIKPVVRYWAEDMLISRDGHGETLLSASSPVCAMTVREELDEYCLKQALGKGAKFEKIKGLEKIEQHNDSVEITTLDGKQFEGRYLIGADGAHSQVRKLTRAFSPDRTAVALEGILPLAECRRALPMTFDFGAVREGYGWVFPKGDHVNVGLYTRRPDRHKVSKQMLKAYSARRLGTDTLQNVCGYPIATGGEFYQVPDARVLLVGDAAGMAEALLGEGIHNAIHSGQIAVASIVHGLSQNSSVALEYQKRLQWLQRDVYNCRRIARCYYKTLPVAFQGLKRYPVKDVLINGFAAGMTLTECLGAFPRFQTRFDVAPSATLG